MMHLAVCRWQVLLVNVTNFCGLYLGRKAAIHLRRNLVCCCIIVAVVCICVCCWHSRTRILLAHIMSRTRTTRMQTFVTHSCVLNLIF
jgi:hypothetical protein